MTHHKHSLQVEGGGRYFTWWIKMLTKNNHILDLAAHVMYDHTGMSSTLSNSYAMMENLHD